MQEVLFVFKVWRVHFTHMHYENFKSLYERPAKQKRAKSMIMTHIFFKLISVENFATFLCPFDLLWLRMLNHIRQFDESYSGLWINLRVLCNAIEDLDKNNWWIHIWWWSSQVLEVIWMMLRARKKKSQPHMAIKASNFTNIFLLMPI